jgi:3-deoxy-D-manno-octulosonic-acid transferase
MWATLINIYNLLANVVYFGLVIFGKNNSKINKWINGRTDLIKNLKTWRSNHPENIILFHCASLGELEQAYPVIENIKKKNPEYLIVVSFFSPSGYENTKNTEVIDFKTYSPVDTKQKTKEFITVLNPVIAVFIKNEFWPNYINELYIKDIPIIFTSTHIVKNNAYPGLFYNHIFRKINHIFVQTIETKKLLNARGIDRVSEAGDLRMLKAKSNVNAVYIDERLVNIKKPVIIYGSIWKEDFSVLKEFIQTKEDYFHVIAPHDLSKVTLSYFQKALISCDHTLLIDTMGDLKYLYRYGMMAYIGGAFGAGLHNILEPAAYGIPILFGPNYNKFEEAKSILKIGGAASIQSSEEFEKAINNINQNYLRYKANVIKFNTQHQPDLNKVINYISKYI